jgi:hypothetical protein
MSIPAQRVDLVHINSMVTKTYHQLVDESSFPHKRKSLAHKSASIATPPIPRRCSFQVISLEEIEERSTNIVRRDPVGLIRFEPHWLFLCLVLDLINLHGHVRAFFNWCHNPFIGDWLNESITLYFTIIIIVFAVYYKMCAAKVLWIMWSNTFSH